MDQTLEELLAQKTPVLYRAGHVSIRQLAERLRTAMKDSSKGGKETKAMQYAYGLPFVKSVKLWVQAVSRCAALKPLVQPLIIVILSAIRAKESHLIFAPYVSILLGLINDLSVNCQVFVPVASSCMETLSLCSNKLASKALTAEGREPNITDVVRVSERQLKDRRVVRGLSLMVAHQLARHLSFLARTSALPEVGWVVLQNLRKLVKANPAVKQDLSGLISSLEKSISEVKDKRKNVEGLFQFGAEETTLGRFVAAWAPKPTYENRVDDSDSGEDSEADSVESEAEAVRSKRSLKRQRQKEKKRMMMQDESAETIIEKVEKGIGKIDATELVPFEMSDDE